MRHELTRVLRPVMQCNMLKPSLYLCYRPEGGRQSQDWRSPEALAAAGDNDPFGVVMAASCCRPAAPRPTGDHALAAWPSNDGRLQASSSGHATIVMGMTALQLECASSVCRTLMIGYALAFGADPCWHANWDPREFCRSHPRMVATATGASTNSPTS